MQEQFAILASNFLFQLALEIKIVVWLFLEVEQKKRKKSVGNHTRFNTRFSVLLKDTSSCGQMDPDNPKLLMSRWHALLPKPQSCKESLTSYSINDCASATCSNVKGRVKHCWVALLAWNPCGGSHSSGTAGSALTDTSLSYSKGACGRCI